MDLTKRQLETKSKIEFYANLFSLDPLWTVSIAMTESSLGLFQRSPTGCRGVFQMSSIAMKDLLQEMETVDDDLIDIVCGLLFLRLLLKRWKTVESATDHFCDPNDRWFYLKRVKQYMRDFEQLHGQTDTGSSRSV